MKWIGQRFGLLLIVFLMGMALLPAVLWADETGSEPNHTQVTIFITGMT